MTILGIDPGVSGALVWLRDGASVLMVCDIPTFAAGGRKGRRIIDTRRLLELLNSFPADTAVLEEVSSMPRDGHVGAFSFGRAYGVIEMALTSARIPFHTVRPQVWKRKLGVTGDKDQSRLIATRLIPHGADQWPLKKDHHRADAALLAYYGERICSVA